MENTDYVAKALILIGWGFVALIAALLLQAKGWRAVKFDLRYSALLTLCFILHAGLTDFAGDPDGMSRFSLLSFAGLILSIPVVLILCVVLLFKRRILAVLSILVSPIIAGFVSYAIMQPLNFVLPYVKKMQLSQEVRANHIEHKEWLVSCVDDWAANSYMFRRAYVYDLSDNIRSDANTRDLGDHFYLYETERRNCEDYSVKPMLRR